MSVLKKLINCAVLPLLCIITSAKAQILGIGVNFEKLNLPEEFLHSLQNCQTYKYEQPAAFENIKVNTIYNVITRDNGGCRLRVEGFTNTSVHIIQYCDLTAEKAAEYANALRRYQHKNFSPRWDGDKINSDEDYQAAYKIMADMSICRFHRDAIDNTALIRKNLPLCAPAEQTESSGNIKIRRQIIGTREEHCNYLFTVSQSSKEAPNSKTMSFSCRFDKAQSQRYLQILQSLVIEAEEGYDFSAVQRVSVAEELNFILDNCRMEALQ